MAAARSSTTPNEGTSPNACLSCRSVKMKCRMDSGNAACERCLRKSLKCVFEKHRRGRKLGTKLKKHTPGASSVNGSQASSSRDMHNGNPFEAAEGSKATSEMGKTNRTPGLTSPSNSIQYRPDSWVTPGGGLQPAELLNREAKGGNFSLQNILSFPEDNSKSRPSTSQTATWRDYGSDDPITAGVLTQPIAVALFDHFMRSQNPYLSQLDPKLHTFNYVRSKSSFLFTSMFTATSKTFHPSLYSALRNHRDMLLGKAFAQGDKSVEVVQAILIITYWKEPDETRTWLLIGYAIRMCLELGWHELKLGKLDDSVGQDELLAREARNIERTWLVLFVYDRSLSSQMGKPWMIDQNDLIRHADDWLEIPIAAPGIDVLLCGFVRLRIMHCEIIELIVPSSGVQRKGTEMPLKLFNIDLTAWETKWVSLLGISENEHTCQQFLLRFYGMHLRLLLNSFSLQESLSDTANGIPISKNALWTCFSSAVGMMDLISIEFGPLKLLYFAQDSVHVMTAYATVFLIKLMLSLPSQLRAELEGTAITAVRNAGNTFKEQCATTHSGCALQARFLSNVVEKYNSMRSKPQSSATSQPPETSASHTEEIQNPTPMNSAPKQQQQLGGPSSALAHNHYAKDHFMHGMPMPMPMPQDGSFAMNQAMAYNDGTAVPYSFADDNLWELMFADAGFSINEGVFMNENR